MSENAKTILDAASISVTVAALASWLPAIAAIASLIWTCIRIYETKTVQRWLKGERFDRRIKHHDKE